MSRHLHRSAFTALALLLLLACGGRQSQQTMFNPAGPMASRVEGLWWLTFWIATAVFVIVMALFSVAAARRRVTEQLPPDLHPDPGAEQRYARRVIGATVLTVAILFAVLGHTLVTGRNMNALFSTNPVSIQVIGHQWWWEVQYPNSDVSQWVTTANEIHVPVGVPVVVQTSSHDVIHSFWAPNLQGKRDLIPGYQNTVWFQADREGIFRGQCAEFCGYQHAHMAFYVVAESKEKFQQWLQQQVKPAPDPLTAEQQHGRDVFVKSTCVMCHTVRGTDAGSRMGPDLTHMASRLSLAAGTLPNNAHDLDRWISDPQSIKEGARMPANPLPAQDKQALIAYLETLK